MRASTELIQVGEVAERLGVSPRTIKYYEELGLIEPEARSQGGFRLYGEEDVHRLQRILRMKGMGYSLAAARELMAVRDAAQEATKVDVLSQTVGRLEEREREVSQRIREMGEELRRAEELRRELQNDIALCRRRIEEIEQEGGG